VSGGQQRDAGHGHGLPGAGHRRPLAIVLGISATILAAEVAGAVVSGSLALLADAGHMLTDVAGLAGNAVSIMLLSRISGGNLNTRAARLEAASDALGSVAVLIAVAVIALTGWARADAAASLLIGALILPRTWKLLFEPASHAAHEHPAHA
jgi:cobalt-zinc-cadmium efflux system protein